MIFSLFDRHSDRKRKDSGRSEPGAAHGGDATLTRGGPDSTVSGGHTLSGPKFDAREQARRTVAKIDEIESEMMQSAAAVPHDLRAAGSVFVPASARAAAVSAPVVEPAPALLAPTPPPPAPPAPPVFGVTDWSVASAPVEVLPESLEEATVLYANGQSAAAAAVLVQAAREPGAGRYLKPTWFMLFDLYQATGNQDEFEALAIGFSARFESSPPTWDPSLVPPECAQQSASATPLQVTMPWELNADAFEIFARIEQHLAQQKGPVVLDVSLVTVVDPVGAARMVHLLDGLGRSACECFVLGADRLLLAARAASQVGRRDVNDGAWRLALLLLRILDRPHPFDDLAIDYCVTYEVSPPSWEPAPASIRLGAPPEPLPQPEATSPEPVHAMTPQSFILRGVLDSRAHALWMDLHTYALDRSEIVLDCRALRRLDFAAAGEMLNQIVALRAGGKYCVLNEVSHLVGGLLVVMGITGLAEVRLRRR